MARINPYEKYLGPEDKIHIACFKYAASQYPHLLIHHSPNEGKRSKFEQYKISQMGVKKGFPDFICLNSFNLPDQTYKGLAIEFKAVYKNGQVNTESPDQIKWGKKLKEEGYFYTVITSFDTFKIVIDNCYKHKLRK